jgi:pimeloyl-ACP methyl ester carboxylesterase
MLTFDRLAVEGTQLGVADLGSGKPVLLVHGTAASVWGDVPSMLARTHRVLVYDRRSFGTSIHPPLADLSRHASDAAAVLRTKAALPAIVVGWSIGGVIALELALRHPELVKALVLLEPPLHAKRRPSLGMVRAILGAKVLGRWRSPRAGASAFLHWAFTRSHGGNDLANAPGAWREEILANGAAIVRELDAGTGEHLSTEQLADLRLPIRWLLGAESQPAFAKPAHRAKRYLKNLVVEQVDGAGHCIQWDRPDAVVGIVEHLG